MERMPFELNGIDFSQCMRRWYLKLFDVFVLSCLALFYIPWFDGFVTGEYGARCTCTLNIRIILCSVISIITFVDICRIRGRDWFDIITVTSHQHNGVSSVSRLFFQKLIKTDIKFHHDWLFAEEIHRWQLDSLHKGPVLPNVFHDTTS